MARKSYLTSEEHSALPEAQKTDYKAHGDGFVLDVESVGGWRLEDVGSLQSAYEKVKRAEKEARDKLKAYEGIDPEQARAALADDGKKSDEKTAARIKAIEADFQAKIKAEQDRAAAIEGQLQTQMIQAAATAALSKHKGDADLLMPHIQAAVRVVKGDDGGYALALQDGKGGVLHSQQTGRLTDPMPLEEYVGSVMKARFPAAFPGTGQTGSGSTASGRSGAGRFTLTESEARDVNRYQAARAEAEKAGTTVSIV